jgi:hypothetical protein
MAFNASLSFYSSVSIVRMQAEEYSYYARHDLSDLFMQYNETLNYVI